MHPPGTFPATTTAPPFSLNPQQFTQVQRAYQDARTPPVRDRALAIMLIGRASWTPLQVGEFLGLPESQVQGYVAGWQGNGLHSLGIEAPQGGS